MGVAVSVKVVFVVVFALPSNNEDLILMPGLASNDDGVAEE